MKTPWLHIQWHFGFCCEIMPIAYSDKKSQCGPTSTVTLQTDELNVWWVNLKSIQIFQNVMYLNPNLVLLLY